MAVEIPLQGGARNAHQTLSVQLGENFVELRINYITRFDTWTMDVVLGGATKIAGAMLLPSADVSASHRAGLGRFLFIGERPTLDNLGDENKLVWFDG